MLNFIVGDSELAGRIRAYPWADTPLGSAENWPDSLKTLVSVMLAANQQMYIVWGPSRTLLYNDRYIEVLQAHHPKALGRCFIDVWREIADDLTPLVERAYAGIPTYQDDILLMLQRGGRTVETHFTYSYTPVFNASGGVDGFICHCIETTAQVNASAALRESEERRELALEATDVGTFIWHVQADRGEPDARMLALFGQPPDGTLTLRDAIATMIHPDDAPRYAAAVAEASRFEGSHELHEDIRVRNGDAWRWVAVNARIAFDGNGQPLRMAGTGLDVTERKRTETVLRESEERQALLLKLSDSMRSANDDSQVLREASRLVGQHFGSSSHYAEVVREQDVDYYLVRFSYTEAGRASFDGKYPVASFPGATDELYKGRTVICADVQTDPRLSEEDKTTYSAANVGNFIMAPLIRESRLAAVFSAHGPKPRSYSNADARIIEEMAGRTWAAIERVRAEEALRESEERFRQFANASAGALWIRDAKTLSMEYASPAIAEIYGTSADALLGDVKHFAAMIVPEDRDNALKELGMARRGEAVVHEFRIQRLDDQTFRWIRDTNFPLYDSHGHVQRIGGIFEDVTDARLAAQHQSVLLSELQHRVRNIMAMIRSVTARTGERAGSVADYAGLMAGRLLALARVQTLLTRAANAGVPIATIVHDEIAAVAAHDGQFELSGPEIVLSPKASEVMTLALHELATNALNTARLQETAGTSPSNGTCSTGTGRRGSTWIGASKAHPALRVQTESCGAASAAN